MSPLIHKHLADLSSVVERVHKVVGHRPPYMPITDKFATMLEEDGFVPQFHHVRGYGLCWLWMIWDNFQIVSTIE